MSSHIITRVVPNLLVFAALGALAWWGHRSGWTIPKLSGKNAQTVKAKTDWCDAHNITESICVECDESLMPRPKKHGWCYDHGVHECPLCHPELAQLHSPFQVTAEMRAHAKYLAAGRPENNRTCRLHERRIQFASRAAAEKAGLADENVNRIDMIESTPTVGEIIYDHARVAHLSPRSSGRMARAFAHLGDEVKAGQLLGIVESAAVGKAKEDFTQAAVLWEAKRQALNRFRGGSSAEAIVAAAETALRESRVRLIGSRQSLINLGLASTPEDLRLLSDEQVSQLSEDDLARSIHFLGIPEKALDGLDKQTVSSNLMAMRSPINGHITSNDLGPDEAVEPGRPVFTVVDSSVVWLMLDVRAEDVDKIVPKETKVLFTLDGSRTKDEVKGVITWISNEADEKTRTVKARAIVANPDGKLRAKMFGRGRVVVREEKQAIVVPNAAVHFEGDCHVVFVRDKNWFNDDSPKVYHTRTVRVGMRGDKFTEIIAGVLPDEVVATKGSETLRAELLSGNFGEGCGCCK